MLIDDLLRSVVESGASDLHLKPGRPPMQRLKGRLQPMGGDPLAADALRTLLMGMLPEKQRAKIESDLYADFAYSVPGVSRFRATIFHQRGTLAAVLRRVPIEFPSLDEWNLPEVLKEFTKLQQGLVLVTGPTGSGKSSTLAALIREIVERRPVHVVSVEDPIEFLIRDGTGTVTQREIGTDSLSFAHALRNTLRQDPDVIMVGEMRDLETISSALSAAETGHLVVSTLHTSSAAQTVDRIIGAFPEGHHTQIQQQLSRVIEAVICLRLVERQDGAGRVAAVEILRSSPRVRKLVEDGALQELHEEIERSVAYERMQSLNQSLAALVINGVITRERALTDSPSPEDLDLLLRKMLYAGEHGATGLRHDSEDDMALSKADFSHILRLQEIEKNYEELQERFGREIAERDARILQLEAETQGASEQGGASDAAMRTLLEEKDKLARALSFQKQEYEMKLEKLQNRIRELSNTAAPAEAGPRGGIFRR